MTSKHVMVSRERREFKQGKVVVVPGTVSAAGTVAARDGKGARAKQRAV